MGRSGRAEEGGVEAVRVSNDAGRSRYLLLCDHASNHLPAEFGSLGLGEADLLRHIAWDPGAAAVCRHMSQLLDATLAESCISRLVIDCNRPLDAPDLIAAVSETTAIPGNANISAVAKARRVALAYEPYHAAVEDLIERRIGGGRETWLIAVHSFTPVYAGVPRPWQVGVIHDEDERLAAPLLARLSAIEGLTVGINQPYSPADRVYHTLERHARSRGLPCVMIELRNDEIADPAGQRRWAERLAAIFNDLNVERGREEACRPEVATSVQPVN